MIKILLPGTVAVRFIFWVTTGAALFGCATARLSNDVQPYVGRNIQELTARLGGPTGKQETTGDPVYVWSISSEGVLPSDAGTAGAPTRITTVNLECKLEVTVGAENVIRSYAIEGSDAGCAAFRRHLIH